MSLVFCFRQKLFGKLIGDLGYLSEPLKITLSIILSQFVSRGGKIVARGDLHKTSYGASGKPSSAFLDMP